MVSPRGCVGASFYVVVTDYFGHPSEGIKEWVVGVPQKKGLLASCKTNNYLLNALTAMESQVRGPGPRRGDGGERGWGGVSRSSGPAAERSWAEFRNPRNRPSLLRAVPDSCTAPPDAIGCLDDRWYGGGGRGRGHEMVESLGDVPWWALCRGAALEE